MRRGKAIYHITEAPKSLSDDVNSRQRKYLISMGIRVVVFGVAAAVPLAMPLRLLGMLAALVIPYIAVVVANAGREPTAPAESYYQLPGPDQIGRPAPGQAEGQGASEQATAPGASTWSRAGDTAAPSGATRGDDGMSGNAG